MGIALCVRLCSIFLFIPTLHQKLFIPFLAHISWNTWYDPWTTFIANGGSPGSFPYGVVLLLALCPAVLIQHAGEALGIASLGAIGLGLTLLVWELLLVKTLQRLPNGAQIATSYWKNPIPWAVTYWHGQLEVIPLAIIFFSLGQLTQYPRRSGLWMGLAMAAKIHAGLATVFTGIHIWRSFSYRDVRRPFLIALGIATTTGLGITFLSPGARAMMFESSVLQSIWQIHIDGRSNVEIYVFPLVMGLLVHNVITRRWIDTHSLWYSISIAYGFLALISPMSFGWTLWFIVPTLVALSHIHSTRHVVQTSASMAILVGIIYGSDMPSMRFTTLSWHPSLNSTTGHIPSLNAIFTTVLAGGIIMLILRLWQAWRNETNTQLVEKRGVFVGIAGDSSTGKDTLVGSIQNFYGKHDVLHLACDGYHRWDRGAPMWDHLTHLDPRANRLHAMSRDLEALSHGCDVNTTEYDHATGPLLRAPAFKQRDILLVNGLHTLRSHASRRLFDLSIFLEMENDLRRDMKIRRDCHERGHQPESVLRSFERRFGDGKRFVEPQRDHADLIFSLRSLLPELKSSRNLPLQRLGLCATTHLALPFERLADLIVAWTHAAARVFENDDASLSIEIEGDISAIHTSAMAQQLSHEPLFSVRPDWDNAAWQSGTLGLMQMIVFLAINHVAKRGGT